MPPPQLHRHSGGAQDGGHRVRIDSTAGECAVQIDDVQPAAAGILPGGGLRARIVGIDGGIRHLAPAQADASAVLEVNGGVEGSGASATLACFSQPSTVA